MTRSSMSKRDQADVLDLIITALEKFHWDSLPIANFIKVKTDSNSETREQQQTSHRSSWTRSLAASGMSWLGRNLAST